MSLFRTSIGYSSTQTKLFLFLALLMSMLFLGTLSAEAASNHYVRSGASGNNSGSDWTNAYTDIPSTLVRGDTYYVADGTGYSGNGLNTPVSGTTPIYIKKCPSSSLKVDACQSVSGWSNNYGTGQAVFNQINIGGANSSYPGYITMDGQVDYGFRINVPNASGGGNGITISCSDGTNYAPGFTFSHIEMVGAGSDGNNWGFALLAYSGCNTSPLLVSHNSIHGMNTAFQLAGGSGITVEYNDMYNLTGANHTNVMWIGNPTHDLTIRYNKSHSFDTEGFFITWYNGGTPSSMYNFYIYGNLFYDGLSYGGAAYPNGIQLRDCSDSGNVGSCGYGATYIYNNTCADMNYACVVIATSATSGGIRNNIGYGSASGFQYGSMSNSNNLETSNSSIFVNYASKDFHLASHTTSGTTLSSPYNVDRDGITRGADGVWDLGAYQYGGGLFVRAAAPVNLRFQ